MVLTFFPLSFVGLVLEGILLFGISLTIVFICLNPFFSNISAVKKSRGICIPFTVLFPSTPQNHVDANEEIRALKAQISRLEKELDNAQIKVELYNEMINVAERHFNIRIRKKSGAK